MWRHIGQVWRNAQTPEVLGRALSNQTVSQQLQLQLPTPDNKHLGNLQSATVTWRTFYTLTQSNDCEHISESIGILVA
jgi:hypothetical protein